MYVKQVEISNIRSINNFKMKFSKPAGWHVLIGDNGSGKTTIMRSIALALIGYDNSIALQQDWREWLNKKSTSGFIKLQVSRDKKLDFHSYKTSLKTQTILNEVNLNKVEDEDNDVTFSTNSNIDEPNNAYFYNWSGKNGWFSAGYGSFRRLTGGSEQLEKLYDNSNLRGVSAHLSLFHENIALTKVNDWLQEIDYKNLDDNLLHFFNTSFKHKVFKYKTELNESFSKLDSKEKENILETIDFFNKRFSINEKEINPQDPDLVMKFARNLFIKDQSINKPNSTIENLKKIINSEGFLPNNTKLIGVSSKGVIFNDANGNEILMSQLSDGYRSMLSMTFELIRQLISVYGDKLVFKNIIKNDIKIDLPGVVLIDEADLHLHPTWQIKIGKWFTTYFPKMQFIVTTHSPLICRASENGSIWRLADPGSDMKSGEVKGIDKNRLIFGNILEAYGTDEFGAGVTISANSIKKKEELIQLNKKKLLGVITPEEENRLNELRQIFTTDDSIND